MSSCEKCWADAVAMEEDSSDLRSDVVREYYRLVQARSDSPCTPEEQAGPDAATCTVCRRKTLHQHTGQPMCLCPDASSPTPCPHCGHAGPLIEEKSSMDGIRWTVTCPYPVAGAVGCGASVEGRTRWRAVAAWNLRTPAVSP